MDLKIEDLEKRLLELNRQQMEAQIRQKQASDAAQKASLEIITISGRAQEVTYLIAQCKAKQE